ncbi:MAG: YbaK/EbsC family protein, partial [Acidimicrobiales bacterium]|nr:YbaK/EbsC family protein [Acidimicrobiales bacterium]
LDALPVEASSGAMGGSASVEFMVESPAGEDDVARCTDCGYAANVERASAATTPVENRPGGDAPERFPTPGIRTITALAEAGHPPEHQVKTLVYEADGDLVLILLRGDHPFLEQKFTDATGAGDLRPAEPDRILDALGASPGSLGAVGVDGPTVYADHALRGRSGMTTGANDDDFHLEGVDVERDITVDHWLDLRGILDGEPCVNCGKSLQVVRCIEAGHIFKLGRRYAEAMDMSVLDADGNSRIPTMGSYGIGVGRAMAAVAEVHHDDSGLIWPVAIAPYEVVLTVVKTDHEPSMELAERWTDELTAAGIDVLLDDRDARPGVKFADAELLGIPLRVTIGPRGLDQGSVEFTRRSTGDNEDVAIDDLVQVVLDAVVTGRRLGA